MKWIEAKVIIQADMAGLSEDLISEAFYSLPVSGVVIEDPDEQPEEGWGDGEIFAPEHHAVIGFIPENDQANQKRLYLEKELRHLDQAFGIQTLVRYRHIDEEDWAESWKAFFWPEKISPTLVVKPSWREYDAAKGETVLEIDPGMAFGTGTHPTTRLCVELIETYVKISDAILDVGTGSGILLIAAAKLGAGTMVGVDTDPVAVEITQKNLQRNGIRNDDFSLLCGSLEKVSAGPFDMITANILSEVIIDLLEDVRSLLKPTGLFICSGIIENNRTPVVEKMTDLGLELVDERSLESWVALAARQH